MIACRVNDFGLGQWRHSRHLLALLIIAPLPFGVSIPCFAQCACIIEGFGHNDKRDICLTIIHFYGLFIFRLMHRKIDKEGVRIAFWQDFEMGEFHLMTALWGARETLLTAFNPVQVVEGRLLDIAIRCLPQHSRLQGVLTVGVGEGNKHLLI